MIIELRNLIIIIWNVNIHQKIIFVIRFNHSPPCWMKRHHFSHESEATRVKKKMAGRVFEFFFDFFGGLAPQFGGHTVVHKHFYRKMASENLTVKVTLTREYNFFHESYIHLKMLKVSFQL